MIKYIDPYSTKFNKMRVEVNIDTTGLDINSIELVNRIRKFRPYFEINNGGVIFTGNIFININYLIDTLKLCHKAGIYTSIYIDNDFIYDDNILNNVDLVVFNRNNNYDEIINKLKNKNIKVEIV